MSFKLSRSVAHVSQYIVLAVTEGNCLQAILVFPVEWVSMQWNEFYRFNKREMKEEGYMIGNSSWFDIKKIFWTKAKIKQ